MKILNKKPSLYLRWIIATVGLLMMIICGKPLSALAGDTALENIFRIQDVGGIGADLSLISGLDFEYNSNVFQYSADDVENYDDGINLGTKFQNVESIEDFITRITLGGKIVMELFPDFLPGKPSEFAYRGRFNVYDENSSKDYESHSFELKQRFTKKDIVKVRYTHTPDFFLRDLFDPDVGGYREASFERNDVYASYWRKLNDALRLRFAYRWVDKDYTINFEERDSLTNEFNIALIVPEILPNLKATFFYEFKTQDAKASDQDIAVDDDISNNQNSIGMRLNYAIADRWSLRPFIEYTYKDYTTDNVPASDPLHAEREDNRYNVGIKGQYEINDISRVYVKYEYVDNDADTSQDPASTSREDVLGYKAHIVSWGGDIEF